MFVNIGPRRVGQGFGGREYTEARRLAERFEWRYTPKHGSWLEDRKTLAREVDAWLARRNAGNATADWRFTTEDARIKLSSLYPAI